MALSYAPTPTSVNGPVSDMDRIEQLRAALERIAANAGHAFGGHYAKAAAALALAEDDKLAAEQDAAQEADRCEHDCALCGKPSLVGNHLTCERQDREWLASFEAESLPW